MSKKLRIVISVIITIAVLGTGAGVVLADDNANSNRKPAVVPAEALNKALEKLVADGTITADQVTQIKEQLSKELEQSIDPGQLLKRLLSIQDETKLDEALANLVKENKITPEQSAKIKEQWKAQQERIRFAVTLKRLVQLKTEGELDTALNTLLSEGKITEAQAGKIKEQWKAQQERLRFEQLMKRVLGIKDPAEFDKAMKGLVDTGKLTLGQAAKIKEQWQRMHTRLEQAQKQSEKVREQTRLKQPATN